MTTRPPRKPKAAPAEAPNSVAAAIATAARLTEEAAATQAPVMSRAVTALNMAQQRRNELARERSDFVDRMNLLSAHYKAAVDALQAHIDDIDEEDALYANGFPAKSNVEPIRPDVERAVA